MPRLFDLLPEHSKKELVAEKNRKRPPSKKHRLKKPKQGPDTNSSSHRSGRPPSLTIPDFVALDVETTGLTFKTDRIIEIGAVKFIKGEEIDTFSTFINPGVPVPPAITDLTGISDSDLSGAPEFSATAKKLLSFIGTLPICGHQIEFDATFLKEELKRTGGTPLKNQLIDTALFSRVLLDPRGRFSLKHVCGELEITLDNAHRALHDARASGEAALRLIPKIADLPAPVRRTMAACAPSSLFKTLLFESLGGQKPGIVIDYSRESPPARLPLPEEYKSIDRKHIRDLLSEDGPLSRHLPGYTPRKPQQEMARGVADALNTQSFYIAEAGTGTGKSLGYLIPAAQWACANHCRIIISTRTRNLQDQLVSRDLPVAAALTGNELKSTVLKGRRNYLCLHRFVQLLQGKTGNISPRERFAILPLIAWSAATATGDIEEQNLFNPKWFSKIWNIISAEHHECTHRRCPFYQSCFLQKARARALGSHIVIINHALFFSDICSGSSFLGPTGPLIFDEAHHLESSGHRFLRVELDTSRINLFTEVINNLVGRTGALKDEKVILEKGKTLKSTLRQFRKLSSAFLSSLNNWAKENHPDSHEYQITCKEEQFSATGDAGAFLQSIMELSDRLRELKQAIEVHPDAEKLEAVALETQACAERTSQLKADFLYLSAARTEEHVFWIEGNHSKGWTKLCGVPLDVGSLLSEIWEQCNGAVIFTSATLSVARSFDYFKRTVGLVPHEQRTASAIFKSPFGTHQSIAGALRNAPLPDAPTFSRWVASAIVSLHAAHKKNMLILFTANSMLSTVYRLLREEPSIQKGSLLAQGMSGSRQIILDEFRKNSGMILLGTDSFWEGIDAPGEACEMVIIPRLPFPVPTHPLTRAIAQRMQQLNGESFFSYSVPEAVIRFRQGAGRLIRTTDDRGALIIFDSRICSRGYGKQFTRSIDVDFREFDTVNHMITAVSDFFNSPPPDPESASDITYVPLEEA